MPLDPNIILAGSAPVQIQGPLDSYSKLLALKNAQQSNALNAQQIQGAQLANQRGQQDMADIQALRGLYANGQQPTNEQLMAAAPTKAPAIIKARLDVAEAKAKLQSSADTHAAAAKDYIGSTAYAIQQSGYDPAVVEHSLADAAQYFPDQAKQLAALYQSNPQAFHQQIDQAVLASPKQQQLASERTTAQARQSQAATTAAHDKVTESQGAQRLEQEAANNAFNQSARTQELGISRQRLNQEVQGAAGLQLTPAGLDAAAESYAKTGTLPPMGMSKGSAGVRTAIINRAAELNPNLDIAGNKAAYGADTASLKKLQTQSDIVDAFENTAEKNIDNFLKVGKQIQDSGVPILNTPIRKLSAKLLGQANYGAFEAQRQVAATETAKVLQSANASGVLSDQARKEAETLLDPNATFAQWQSAANALKMDFANRKASNATQIQAIRSRLGGGSTGAPTHGIPDIGSTFNGGKVLKVTRIQ